MKTGTKLITKLIISTTLAIVNLNAQEIINPVEIANIKENNIAQLSIQRMNSLIKQAIISEALVNDGDLSIADVREINNYLVLNHSDEWNNLRGDMLETKIVHNQDVIYNLGFKKYNENSLSNYSGAKSSKFITVKKYLSSIMKNILRALV